MQGGAVIRSVVGLVGCVSRMRPGHPGWLEGDLLRGSMSGSCLPSQSATVTISS